MDTVWMRAGALLMALAVAAGAFGAHGLKRILTVDQLAVWQTAVLYHLIHGLGLILVAQGMSHASGPWLVRSAALLLAGTVLFSGSLYAITLTGATWLGPVTPLGGVCLIAGWLCLLRAAWSS
ncbi:DUF423 domain-containing protein [Amphibiibacter pelophylacis]|uniref:DUF423 domain-containing protein n=1 Tax=Amphibiibacter pelophylacis TaxID=1799477 RepID=A0ACC6NZ73_9BURK